ncbi:MAG: hypothetical protein AAB519_01735 [Patescibacteria group bacterium]
MENGENLDWKRIGKALFQEARRIGKEKQAEELLESLQKLVLFSGQATRSRKVLFQIGRALLKDDPVLLVPICQDYRFGSGLLGSEVPALAQLHAQFLEKVTELFPCIAVRFLIADQESESKDLCQDLRKTPEDLSFLMQQSAERTGQYVASKGWQTLMMTDVVDNLLEKEEETFRWIVENPAFHARIVSDVLSRGPLYDRVRTNMPFEEKKKRTAYTAAQYVVLGRYASEHGFLVCGHTTTNLSWYLQCEVGILHNPVSLA